jgi:CRISPR type I-E-associated protein CasB/Cse2
MNLKETESTKKSVGDIAQVWWTTLRTQSGAKARLRRCGTILDVVLEPETHILRREVLAVPELRGPIEPIALIAGVLVWIDETTDLPPGAHLAKAAQDYAAIEPRFRRLLREDRASGDELLSQWRRMLALLKGVANPSALASTLFYWGDAQKKRLATEFYENI